MDRIGHVILFAELCTGDISIAMLGYLAAPFVFLEIRYPLFMTINTCSRKVLE